MRFPFNSAFGMVLLATAAFSALAQPYPSRPIKLVDPFPPGSVVDVIGRIAGTQLQQVLGQPVLVDNRSGAGGSIGAEFVAKAPPDGYTLLITTSSTHAIAPAIRKEMPYDAVKDFTPMALVVRGTVVIVAHPSLQVKTLAELVKYAKDNPGKISYGSAGIGTISHFGGEILASRTGTKLVHVPYRGGAPAANDLAAGTVQVMIDSLGTQMPNIKGGKVRPLAVMLPQRSAQVPDVPTVREAGFADLEFATWIGLFGPAGMPKDVVKKVVDALREGLSAPDVREKLALLGQNVVMQDGDTLQKYMVADQQRYADLVRTAGIEKQ
jgi:tripartite-type tricarboxylate transporter receptor subunit TctC